MNNQFQSNAGSFLNASGNKKQLKVTKFIIIETPVYGQQFRRPYNAQIDGKVIDDLNNRSNGSNTFSPSMIASSAGNIIMPSAQAEAPINITNGWDTRRMRWMMDVETSDVLGAVVIEKVIGYTDYAGITNTSMLDPNMVFVIDGITTCNRVKMMTDYGMQESTRVIDSSNIIADNDFNGINYYGSKHLMRPSDIFSTVSFSSLEDANGMLPTVNTGVVTPSAQLSSIKHSNPSEYLSNILTNYTENVIRAEYCQKGAQEILHDSRSASMDRRPSKVSFLSAIAAVRDNVPGNSFTLSDLLRIAPDVPNVMQARMLSQADRLNTNYIGATQSWEASDLETQMSTMVGNSIPSLMASLNISSIMFSSTNRTINGQLITVVTNADTYTGEDLSVPTQVFTSRFNSEIVPIISFNGDLDYHITVSSTLMGDTFINISLGGKPEVPYVTPTYCSSVTTPIVTINRDLIRNTAMQMSSFLNEIGISGVGKSTLPLVASENGHTSGMLSASSLV